MRRFDHEYAQLKALLDSGDLGRALVAALRAPQPRRAAVASTARMVVRDSLVHEVDVTRFLFDEEIASIQIIKPSAESGCAGRPRRPADRDHCARASGKHVDVELFVTTGVAYEVRTEVVAERGSAHDPASTSGLVRTRARRAPGASQITPGFRERFGQAYDTEFQRWVDAVPWPATNGAHRQADRVGRLRRRPRCARPVWSRSTAGCPSRSRWSIAHPSRERDVKIALDPTAVPLTTTSCSNFPRWWPIWAMSTCS